ncbi:MULTISPECIES: hypothetical protein [Sorangium]|uniref:Membrane protein n=1 Tax=Sorangium cellulosum (strain So ce56) TaxID=448385 RepID=A9FHC9_SORC5|nr:hypothetical protein [Sorangium cellulosum]CAN98203.1 putative membrane protein [Sorangium cellulosum So ce56]
MNAAAPSSHLDDIAWNRAGRLSAAQRATLQEILSIHPNEMMAWLFSTTLVGVAALIVVQKDGSQSRFHWGMCALMAAGGLAAAWMPLRRIWLRARLRADIAAGDVAMFPGRVVWRVRRLYGDYVMEPADGSAPVRAAAAPLPPGPYRGYLLPRSRLLIAAESTVVPGGAWSISLGVPDVEGGVFAGRPGRTALAQPFSMAPHVGDRIELFRALASALRFNAEDLGHNRRGRISLRQVGHRLTSSAGFLAMTLCVSASGALFAFFAGFNDSSTFISPIVVVAALHYLWSIRDVFTRRVVTVDGIVKRHLWVTPGSNVSDQSTTTYYFVVQHQKFVVKKRAYRALVPELPYRLYFTKHTRALLSVDPLDTSSSHPRGAPRAGAAWEAT